MSPSKTDLYKLAVAVSVSIGVISGTFFLLSLLGSESAGEVMRDPVRYWAIRISLIAITAAAYVTSKYFLNKFE